MSSHGVNDSLRYKKKDGLCDDNAIDIEILEDKAVPFQIARFSILGVMVGR